VCQVALEIGERAEQVKYEAAVNQCRIDAFLKAAQTDAGGVRPLDQIDEVFQPTSSRGDRVARSPQNRCGVASQAVSFVRCASPLPPACRIFKDTFAACLRERITLQVELLIVGREPCVADQRTDSKLSDQNQV
jgi:hypothetical protein